MSWWHGSWYGNSDWQGSWDWQGGWDDDWRQSWNPDRGWSSQAWRRQRPEQSSYSGRGFTRPGSDTGSTKGKGSDARSGKGRGFTRPGQASQPAGRPDEPDDQYVYAVLPFSLKDDWPPNSYAQAQEEIADMGCHISTRARKKAGNKKQIRVTVKGQMAQDAFDLFCQRAQELITREIDWTSVPFRRKARDQEEKAMLQDQEQDQEKSDKKDRVWFFIFSFFLSYISLGY